jgi:hypothetical protein
MNHPGTKITKKDKRIFDMVLFFIFDCELYTVGCS